MTEVLNISNRQINSPPCIECGSEKTSSRFEVDHFDYQHGEEIIQLQAKVEVHTCADCGFEFTDSTAEDARHNALCEFLGVLTPEEVKAVRNQYGLSRSQMASASKIGEASLARWEAGSLVQSGAYDNYLFLLKFEENMRRIQQRATGGPSEQQGRKWQSITVTDAMLEEQGAFKLTPQAA